MPAIPAASPACTLLPRRDRLPVSSSCSSLSPRPRLLPSRLLRLPARPRAAPMSAEARAPASPVPPPAHPTYELKAIIALALSEDAGDRGDVSCLATIPSNVEAEATFIAKADGVIAGIGLADMIFNQVDSSLKVTSLHHFSCLRFWQDMISIVGTGDSNYANYLFLIDCRLNGLKVMEIMSIKDYSLAKYMVNFL
ncbi:hypothetical protein PR202_gb23259 [Eleusine coracana subsp. coracana]|uniref:Quinolinate phosphoribosyl transferase N-terminal domain-containing protein n=1 Tax=Eleusine coracana subsp. coracana TaxID=191504 RepID=A0AAV5FIN4_ELECO|nr:hypothetical protein PR202_gb23259 [Eleusine coracana subsp. coracana]